MAQTITARREGPAFVYIVECSDGSWYTGWTTDPKRRVLAHNRGKGAKYTRSRLPVRLIYTEACADWRAAMRREYAIKQLSRKEKERLVQRSHEQDILSDGKERFG